MFKATSTTILIIAFLLVAPATSLGAWTKVTEHNGSNTDDPSMVRAGDGTLHFIYKDQVGTNYNVRHRTLSANGTLWSAPTSVVDNWVGISNPDIELIGGTPYAFWGGQGAIVGETSSGRAWYATFSSGAWTRSASPLTFRASPYASTSISSAVASDESTPWITWTGTGILAFHQGLSQGDTEETNLSTGCCQYASNIERDAATGDLYAVWFSNEALKHGIFSQRIAPALGDELRLPSVASSSAFLSRSTRLPAAARTTGGVYTAYCETYPTCTRLRVAASSGPSLSRATGPKGANPSEVWTAAAPFGRMWLAWGDNNQGIFAVRSNRALTRWSPVIRITPPTGTTYLWNVKGEGSAGPLDLLVNLTTPEGTNAWHQRIKPVLSLNVVSRRRDRAGRMIVTLRVTDAGDSISARVRLRGVTRTAPSNGRVRFIVPASNRTRFATALASRSGYSSARLRVRLR